MFFFLSCFVYASVPESVSPKVRKTLDCRFGFGWFRFCFCFLVLNNVKQNNFIHKFQYFPRKIEWAIAGKNWFGVTPSYLAKFYSKGCYSYLNVLISSRDICFNASHLGLEVSVQLSCIHKYIHIQIYSKIGKKKRDYT